MVVSFRPSRKRKRRFTFTRSVPMRGSRRLAAVSFLALAAILVVVASTPGDDKPTAPAKSTPIDASALHHKVLCGYQGWFRCPGDPADHGWRHWSRNGKRIAPATLTFEMWP